LYPGEGSWYAAYVPPCGYGYFLDTLQCLSD
jgi:hypothetical protein